MAILAKALDLGLHSVSSRESAIVRMQSCAYSELRYTLDPLSRLAFRFVSHSCQNVRQALSH